jgi:hypothetical protein
MRDGMSHGGMMTIDNRDEVQAQGNDEAYLRLSRKLDMLHGELDAHGVKLEQARTDLDVAMAQIKVLEQAVAQAFKQ